MTPSIFNELIIVTLSGARGKQAKEQATAVVMVEKIRHQPFGVLLSKRPYTSDETFGVRCIKQWYVTF